VQAFFIAALGDSAILCSGGACGQVSTIDRDRGCVVVVVAQPGTPPSSNHTTTGRAAAGYGAVRALRRVLAGFRKCWR